MAYVDQYAVGEDATFQSRVQIAALTYALTVQGEAVGGISVQRYQKRQALAGRVLVNPVQYKVSLARLIATGSTVTLATTDATLLTIITNNWDKVAGIDVNDG